MYKTPVKQKLHLERICLVCGNFAKEVRKIESTRIKGKDLKILLQKYGGLNIESGIMCRNCFSKLDTIDKKCTQFYEECQKNALKVLSRVKRMRSSPLSGITKRKHVSSTPEKSSKSQLFQHSTKPESDLLSTASLDISVNDHAINVTQEINREAEASQCTPPEAVHGQTTIKTVKTGPFDTHLILSGSSISHTLPDQTYFNDHDYSGYRTLPPTTHIDSTDCTPENMQVVSHFHSPYPKFSCSDAAVCDSRQNREYINVEKPRSLKAKNYQDISTQDKQDHQYSKSRESHRAHQIPVKSASGDHGYSKSKFALASQKKLKRKQQSMDLSASAENQPADHDYVKSRSAPLRFNPVLEEIGKFVKDMERTSSLTNRLSTEETDSLCTVLLTAENVTEVAEKIIQIKDLDLCIQHQKMIQLERSFFELRHRKLFYVSELMKKSPDDLKCFNWAEIVNELMKKFPSFFSYALAMSVSPENMHCYTAIEKVLPRLGLVYSILIQAKNDELSRIQRLISLLLFDNICDQKVFDRLQTVGVSLSYVRSLKLVDTVGGQFNNQLIETLKNRKRFRLVGDNINWKVDVHDQRLDNRSKMMHAFGSAAIVQNVDFSHLCAQAPQRMHTETPVQAFLPSEDDIEQIKHDYVVLVSKTAFDHIPYFQNFEDVVPREISKPCDVKLKGKSTVIPMPVLFRNEQYYQDVIHIMDFYETCLAEIYEKAGADLEGKKVHVGGDQLTRERFSGAKAMRAHHPLDKDKFKHLSPITFELFHLHMNMLKMFFKTLYSKDSVQDIGTLKSLQERISRSNVNENVNEHYDADKDFFISVTDMYIVECLLEFFGMDDVNSKPTKNIPPDFINDTEKKRWYFQTISKMISQQIFPTSTYRQGDEVLEVDGETFCIQLTNGKKITLMKPAVHHTEPNDYVHNYARRVLETGLLFKDQLDLTRMPDRERGIRLLKLTMLYLKSHRNLSKYAYEIMRLLVHQICILSEKEAHEEFYGMFVNTSCKYDSHIPTDRCMEYLVKEIKRHIKHMYSKKTEENITNRTRAISGIREISENYDRQSSVIVRSKKHSDKSSLEDEMVLLEDLRWVRPFHFTPGRRHTAFPNIASSVVEDLNVAHFHDWINTKLFNFAVEKGN